MDFRTMGPSWFAVNVAARAVLIGALAFLATYLVAATNLYATAAVVGGVVALIAADLARTITRADHSLERFLDGLAAGAFEVPARTLLGFAGLARSTQRTAESIGRARAADRREMEYAHTLLDTVAAALIVVEPDGQVTLANRAARALAGRPTKRLEDIPALGAVAEIVRDLAPGARQIVRLADGRDMLASVAQFSTPDGHRRRLIALQRVTGELDAVESKAWQDISRVLAHEMMNSLTPISSLSESLEVLLRQSDPQGEAADAVEAIKRRSLGLMNFIERYRLVAELPKPSPRSIKAHTFVAGIDQLLSATLKEKSITFRSVIAPEDLLINADPELLEQAVINLLRNAVDAVARAASPTIEVSCRSEGGQTVITVSDNGRGLSQDQMSQIFIPFFTTKPGGSGIGLSLARQIALAHGGQIEVHENRPKGTVFRLALPASDL
jgi:nitrogen fixation/metabolism regulation signal transduction histidine kinase